VPTPARPGGLVFWELSGIEILWNVLGDHKAQPNELSDTIPRAGGGST